MVIKGAGGCFNWPDLTMRHIHMYQNVRVYISLTSTIINGLSVKSNINFRKKNKGHKKLKS